MKCRRSCLELNVDIPVVGGSGAGGGLHSAHPGVGTGCAVELMDEEDHGSTDY